MKKFIPLLVVALTVILAVMSKNGGSSSAGKGKALADSTMVVADTMFKKIGQTFQGLSKKIEAGWTCAEAEFLQEFQNQEDLLVRKIAPQNFCSLYGKEGIPLPPKGEWKIERKPIVRGQYHKIPANCILVYPLWVENTGTKIARSHQYYRRSALGDTVLVPGYWNQPAVSEELEKNQELRSGYLGDQELFIKLTPRNTDSTMVFPHERPDTADLITFTLPTLKK